MPRDADYQKHRGHYQEERIMAALANGPLTIQQISAAINLSRTSVQIYIARLKAEPRRVRIHDFATNEVGRRPPRYELGSAPDAVIRNRKPKRADVQIAKILATLAIVPMTARELAIELGVSQKQASTYLRKLRAEPRQVRIADFIRPTSRGSSSPVYALGSRKDAKIKKQTRYERYLIEKEDADAYALKLAKQRALQSVKKATSRPQSWAAALGL